MNIDGTRIGYDEPPYVIAEMSCNHGGDLGEAIELIKAAKRAGANAVKMQCYDADSLTIDERFTIDGGLWEGDDLYTLYAKAATPMAWAGTLFDVAKAEGITMFSSVYCERGLKLLEDLGCPAYKIASFEACHYELLRAVAQTGKPVIVSLGAVDDTEVLEIVRILSNFGSGEYALMHCVSEYPTPLDKHNLRRISKLKQWVNGRVLIGYSDHSKYCMGVGDLAVAAGACILERHLRINRGRPDSDFSDDVWYMNSYCYDANKAWQALQPSPQGFDGARFKRSIRATQAIKAGESLTRHNCAVIRPAGGLHPRMIAAVLSGIATADISRGEALTYKNTDTIGGVK